MSSAPRFFALDVPFASRALAMAEGAKWDIERGVFVWRGAKLPASIYPFRPTTHSWDRVRSAS